MVLGVVVGACSWSGIGVVLEQALEWVLEWSWSGGRMVSEWFWSLRVLVECGHEELSSRSWIGLRGFKSGPRVVLAA